MAVGTLCVSATAFMRFQMPQATNVDGLVTAEGVEATMFAQGPMLTNPTALDVDSRGRVWVTEGHNYRNANRTQNVPVTAEGDRILILEDTNGDGKADSQKIFYQGTDVNAALGITVLGNQVIVSAYENIFLFTDTNGDDKADEKRVLFKRTPSNTDHSTHSWVFGPDGRLYFQNGNGGGKLMDPQGNPIVDRAGNRVVPDSGGAYRQGMVFRVNRDFTGVDSTRTEPCGRATTTTTETGVYGSTTSWSSATTAIGTRRPEPRGLSLAQGWRARHS
jgi:putative membrane-bound dehydrogenase-like protein